jgi:MFS family permease
MNTYACPWHHSLTGAICSFRVAKALRTNPGSRHDISDFRWHKSERFNWSSLQLHGAWVDGTWAVVLKPLWRDQPILALMISETVIWAAIFYSFPALVLLWQGEYGWSATTTLGAFSVALAVQGLAAPHMGRIIDRGGAPRAMTLGTVGALLGLAALTQVTVLWQFYTVWAWMGLMMAATLYDAAFSIVTRARGARARAAITAITLAAGFASTLAYPLTATVAASGGWRAAIWVLAALVLVVVLPLHRLAATQLEAEAQARDPASVAAAAGDRRDGAARVLAAGAGVRADRARRGDPSDEPPAAHGCAWRDRGARHTRRLGHRARAGRGPHPADPCRGRAAARAVTLGAFVIISGAALVLGAATAVPAMTLVFAVGLGVGNGVISILRPVVIREVMGDGGYGESAGAVARLSLFAFAAAPGLGAALADAAGYGTVLALCVRPRLPAPCFSGVCRARERKGRPAMGRPGERWKRFRDQAVSASMAFVPLCAISIRRGFSASGTSRTRSICSMPFSWAAAVTRT